MYRERRIQIDLDERGDVHAWSVTIFNAAGETTYIQVQPRCGADVGTAHEVLGNLAGFEPPVQMNLPMAWERWLDDALSSEDEPPMPTRNDRLR